MIIKILLVLVVISRVVECASPSATHSATHTKSSTATHSATHTKTSASSATATHSATHTKSSTSSSSATATASASASDSVTATATSTQSLTRTSTATSSATKSAEPTHTSTSSSTSTSTTTATPTPTITPTTTTSILPLNLPASQGLAAGTFFAGSAIGVTLFLLVLCFLVPNQLKKLFDGLKKRSKGGFQGSPPEEESLLSVVTTVNPRTVSEVASLQSQLTEKTEELERVRAIAFSPVPADVLKAAATVSVRSVSGGSQFWDRREFLQNAGSHVSLLVQLLDETLVDAFSSSTALQSRAISSQSLSYASSWPGEKKTIHEVFIVAQSLSSLLKNTVTAANEIISTKANAVAALSLGVGSSPSVEEITLSKSWSNSAPARQFLRNSLQVSWTSGAIKFEKIAEKIIDNWLNTLGTEFTNQLGKEAKTKLIKAIALHLKLELWVSSCDNANVSWSLRSNNEFEMVEYNSEQHNLFSFSGRTHAEGTLVIFLGPELRGPTDVFSRATRALVFCS